MNVPARYYDPQRKVWLTPDPRADDAIRCACGRLLFRLDAGWTCLHCPPRTRLIDDTIIAAKIAGLAVAQVRPRPHELPAETTQRGVRRLLRLLAYRGRWLIRADRAGLTTFQHDPPKPRAKKPSTPPPSREVSPTREEIARVQSQEQTRAASAGAVARAA